MLRDIDVVKFHDAILLDEGGLPGWRGPGTLEGALSRVDFRIQFMGMGDVFERLPPCMPSPLLEAMPSTMATSGRRL